MAAFNAKLALLLATGGALGTLARYAMGVWAAPYSQALPWGTICINIIGSFVIGGFGTLTLAAGRFPVAEEYRMFVMVGLCGGFTTFSAFSLQTLDLLRSGFVGRALFNATFSVIACVAATAAGHWAATRVNGDLVAIAQEEAEELG